MNSPITESGDYTIPVGDGVDFTVDVQGGNIQDYACKTIGRSLGYTYDAYIYPGEGYNGMYKVEVNVDNVSAVTAVYDSNANAFLLKQLEYEEPKGFARILQNDGQESSPSHTRLDVANNAYISKDTESGNFYLKKDEYAESAVVATFNEGEYDHYQVGLSIDEAAAEEWGDIYVNDCITTADLEHAQWDGYKAIIYPETKAMYPQGDIINTSEKPFGIPIKMADAP